jgi:hypothetical protein
MSGPSNEELRELLRDPAGYETSFAEPPVEIQDLAALLDAVELFLRRFCVIDDAQAAAATLWVAHTHAIEAAMATPYLYASSAEPESGKTRLLEALRELVSNPIMTMNVSDAALFRTLEEREPTLFFDEVDAVFNPKARERGHRDDLRALLNAGYRRGELVLRMGGGNNTQLQTFRVFGPKALAGLGTLPPTLASRCISITMKRRRADEPVEDFIPGDLADETAELRSQLEAWAAASLDGLKAARPDRIEGLRDRSNEVWRPLLAIAELAGETWAARARRSAVALAANDDDDPSWGLLLLADCHTVFEERGAERIATADLVHYLGELEESPWGEWWIDGKTAEPLRSAPRRVAQLLKPYGIHSKNVRIDESRTPKGYRREDFADAWERFLGLSRTSATSATSATSQSHSQAVVADVADVAHRREPVEWAAWGGRGRFCEACVTPEACHTEHDCRHVVALAAVRNSAAPK